MKPITQKGNWAFRDTNMLSDTQYPFLEKYFTTEVKLQALRVAVVFAEYFVKIVPSKLLLVMHAFFSKHRVHNPTGNFRWKATVGEFEERTETGYKWRLNVWNITSLDVEIIKKKTLLHYFDNQRETKA